MSQPGPLLPLHKLDGVEVHIHIDHVIKITPSDPEPATDSGHKPECGSTLTVLTGIGTSSIEVTEYLLNRGVDELVEFLLVTDLHGMPIKVNPAYVTLARLHEPSGTVLEVHSSTGTEEIYVRDSLDRVGDWWAAIARTRLMDPGAHWS